MNKINKVLMVPDFRDGNPYQSLLAKGLTENNINVVK